MRVTIKDVAREAGVSIKTVSRVLNDEKYVGGETRARVQAVVERLNFRPSIAARALAGGRAGQIALICDNPSPYYVFEMQHGIRERCEQAGVRLLAQPYDRQSGRLLAEIEALIDQVPIDGLILTPPVSDDAAVLDLLARRKLRVVRVSPSVRNDGGPMVAIDNRGAAAAITRHLLDLGHRRIAHIAGDAGYATSAQRREGYADALAQAGLAPDPALTPSGDYGFASGEREAAALLALPIPPTAIFAANDDMAAGALAAAHRLGVAVPAALSVAGFDDSALAAFVWPPLTTVRQPVRAMGAAAAELLLGGADGARLLAHELIPRGSTGPAPR